MVIKTVSYRINQLLQLISMYNDVDAAYLSKTELLVVDASEADLLPCAGGVGFARNIDGALVLSQMDKCDGQTSEVGHVAVE